MKTPEPRSSPAAPSIAAGPEVAAAPTPAQPAAALASVLRVMQPLVRLLVRQGVTYPALAAALKRVFLDAARDELARTGMATTDSALTLLSGVHRRDVRSLTRGPEALRAAEPTTAVGLSAEAIGRWLADPTLGGRRLPRSGPGSFDELVQGISRDVRPRAVLDELLRLGAVSESDAGIALNTSGFVPRQGFTELSNLFAANLHDHAAAAAANLQGEASFLEQAVFVDEIGTESAARLHQVAVQAWKQAVQTVFAEAQARFDHDAVHTPPEQRTERARFGVYFFSRPDEKPAAAQASSDRSPT
jgi:Family of unknown function (DUF6502)